MSAEKPARYIAQLLGLALLFAFGVAEFSLAYGVLVPTAMNQMKEYSAVVPAYFMPAFWMEDVLDKLFTPIVVAGCVLFIIALFVPGPPRLIANCRKAFGILTGVIVCLSLYLLGSAGVGSLQAYSGQRRETREYRETLQEFALLEAAQGRYEQIRESWRKTSNVKAVEVKSVSEFTKREAIERVASMMRALRRANDVPSRRRILASLSLFRDWCRDNSKDADDIARIVSEAGGPSGDSGAKALEWVAQNLGKDGWEPLPLIKLVW